MRVLLAFDKFKGSLTAPQACAATAVALRDTRPKWTLDLCPLADGGDGFAEILTNAAGGALTHETVPGPRGVEVCAHLGLVRAGNIPLAARALLDLPALPDDAPVALVELAQASGLALLAPEQRDPWHTTTLGVGALIRLAAEKHGAHAVVLGVGGSATNDLGLGALTALGLEVLDDRGAPLTPPVPAFWARLARVAGGVSPALPPLRVACDVDNPLLGPRGAAAIYGPQKGLRAEDLRRLDHEAARVALLLCAHAGRPDALMDAPGAGAAGGIAFGLMAAAGARLVPGSALVAAWLDLDARLVAADLVITGEGCFDRSSLAGKGPGAVVARARVLGKPVHIFAGTADPSSSPPREGGLQLHIITPPGTPEAIALRGAAENLARAVRNGFPAAT
jgi:glycerate kinase